MRRPAEGTRARRLLSALAVGAMLAATPATALAADTTAPTLITLAGATTVPQGTPIEFSLTANDPSGVVGSEFQLDGGAWLQMSPVSGRAPSTSRSAAVVVNAGVSQARPGGAFICALMANATVSCSASGTGNVPVQVPGLQGVSALSVGKAHACAIQSDGSLRCWGKNPSGQVGNGTAQDAASPVAIPIHTGNSSARCAATAAATALRAR